MSWQATRWAIWEAEPRSYQEKLVLCALAELANNDGTESYPSKNTIADGLGIADRRQVRRVLHQLERDGLIRKGDQSKANELPFDKRPVVYDLPITMTREEMRESGMGKHNPDKSQPIPGSTFDSGEDDGVKITPSEGNDYTTGGVISAQRPDTDDTPPEEIPDVTEGSGGVLSTPAGGYSVPPKPSINHPLPSTNVDGGAGVLLGAGNPQPHHGENESPSVTNEDGVADRPTLVGANYSTANPPSQSRVWMPTEAAMKTARSSVTVLSINIHLTRYRVRKAEQGKAPNSAEWLRWLLEDEQKAVQAERTKALAEGRSKRKWFGVAGDE